MFKSNLVFILWIGFFIASFILVYVLRAMRYSSAYDAYKSLTGKDLDKLNTLYKDESADVSGMPRSEDVAHNLQQGYIYHHVLTFDDHNMFLIYYKRHLKPYIIKIPYIDITKWFYYVITRHESHGSTFMTCDIYIDLKQGCLKLNELDINNHIGSRFIDILNDKTTSAQQLKPSYNKQTVFSLLHYGKFIRHLVNLPQHKSDYQQRKQIKDHINNEINNTIDQSYYLNN